MPRLALAPVLASRRSSLALAFGRSRSGLRGVQHRVFAAFGGPLRPARVWRWRAAEHRAVRVMGAPVAHPRGLRAGNRLSRRRIGWPARSRSTCSRTAPAPRVGGVVQHLPVGEVDQPQLGRHHAAELQQGERVELHLEQRLDLGHLAPGGACRSCSRPPGSARRARRRAGRCSRAAAARTRARPPRSSSQPRVQPPSGPRAGSSPSSSAPADSSHSASSRVVRAVEQLADLGGLGQHVGPRGGDQRARHRGHALRPPGSP